MSATTEAPGAGAAPADACPRCHTPLGARQEWCLHCGFAARTRVVAATRWRIPVALVAVLLALVLAGLAIAFVAATRDARRVRVIPSPPTQAVPPPSPAVPPTAPSPSPSPADEP